MRRRFLADHRSGSTATLSGQQADHLRRVLRATPGQIFDLLAGGALFRAEISSIDENAISFHLHEELPADAALPIHLLLAVFKFDHFEWALEKSTELGAARITPVLARRTDKHLAQAAIKRAERWRRILLESSKQSRRADLPDLDDPIPLAAALALDLPPHRLLLDEAERSTTLRFALEQPPPHEGPDAEPNHALVLAVGPEGGWAPDEVQRFTAARFTPVTLGPRILRAETAALAALATAAAFF